MLGPELAPKAEAWWGVTEAGNFEGANILFRPVRGDAGAPTRGRGGPATPVRGSRAAARGPASTTRCSPSGTPCSSPAWPRRRPPPATASGSPPPIANGEFLLAELRRDDGRWLRSWQADGGARHLALAADHASLVVAFVALAEATGEARWIAEARSAADALLDLFWDPLQGGAVHHRRRRRGPRRPAEGPARQRHAVGQLAWPPIGLYRLGALTGEARYTNHADQILRLLGPLTTPVGAGLRPPAGGRSTCGGPASPRSPSSATGPSWWTPCTGASCPTPSWRGASATTHRCGSSGPDGFAYVCESYVCQAPVTTVEALAGAAQLGRPIPPLVSLVGPSVLLARLLGIGAGASLGPRLSPSRRGARPRRAAAWPARRSCPARRAAGGRGRWRRSGRARPGHRGRPAAAGRSGTRRRTGRRDLRPAAASRRSIVAKAVSTCQYGTGQRAASASPVAALSGSA